MPKQLSEDLKWRVIYYLVDGYSQKETAKRLYISVGVVNRVWEIYKFWGCVIDPFRENQGRKKTFNTYDMKILQELITEKVDWFLDELVYEMARRTGKIVSVPTLWRSLSFCGITRKKLQKAAKERNEFLRSDFILKISDYNPEQLIFIDETAKDERSISRAYGYSTINTRAMKSVVFIRGKRYTILPALTLDGIIAAEIIEGSCNKENFQAFIINQVILQMNPFPGKNSVIIMDNAVIHHDEALVELIEETGGKVVYLPPYSPDFNPIETAFSTLKAWFKRYRDFVEICDDIEYLILYALSQITPDMARNYFAGSIYI
ncbi:homeodomain-like protein [Rhizophagus clarus]|uniref:Homeodomain-like protein n=1 Tax=Rhizophagus clarus TaxID=94130 RepID=A0A8H3R4G5_9GLOM|nr:homeodomain-like protein [Rhizophagus clarus]